MYAKNIPKPKRLLALVLAVALLLSMSLTASAKTYYAGDSVPIYLDFTTLVNLEERDAYGFPWMATEYCTVSGDTLVTSGDWLYCIDYYNHAQQGLVNSTATSLEYTAQWTALSFTARYGITHALIYGGANYSNEFYGYAATQLIIWEYQLGVRTSPSQTVTFFNATLSSSSRLKNCYDGILAIMALHVTPPSFSGSSVTLRGYGRENGVTVTDSTKQLANDTWRLTSGSGVHIEQNGNDLLIWADEALASGSTASITLQRNLKVATGNAVCALSGAQTVIIGVPPDPVVASLNVTMEATGTLKIVKTSSDGIVEGVAFNVYRDSLAEENLLEGSPFVTDAGGEILLPDLLPGTYVVEELVSDEYVSVEPQTVTVTSANTADNPAVVTFENVRKSWTLELIKKGTSANEAVAGAVYGLYHGGVLKETLTTDAEGRAVSQSYTVCDTDCTLAWTVQEISAPEGWLLDSTVYTLDVSALTLTQAVNTVSLKVYEAPALSIQIIKTSSDGIIEGVKFNVYRGTVSAGNLMEGSPFVTDVNGRILVTGLTPGIYMVEEVASDIYIHPAVKAARITLANNTAVVTFENVRKCFAVKVIKTSTGTDIPVPGAVFGLYHGDKLVAKLTTDQDGLAVSDNFYCCDTSCTEKWTLKELSAPEGFLLDPTVHEITIDPAQLTEEYTLIEVEAENAPLGSLDLIKTDPEGQPLAGAVFLLEYSTDGGQRWLPVSSAEDGTTGKVGTCVPSVSMDGGKVTTPSGGKISFTCMPVEGVLYRLTEVSAPEGYMKLSAPVFSGSLTSGDGVSVSYTVINSPIIQLPPTGGEGFGMIFFSAMAALLALGLLLLFKRKPQKT